MATSCNSLSYCPVTFDYLCLKVGKSFPASVKIWDKTAGAYVDISGDGFELRVYDPTGALITTLNVGTGITIVGYSAKWFFEAPVTDTVAVNTYELDWQPAGGGDIPLNVGKAKVTA